MSFTDYASRIQFPDCFKLAKNWKNNNDITIFRNYVIVKFFWRRFVSLVTFSYWSKFHVNTITGSGVMTISFYEGLTRNTEIGNNPSEFCPTSGDWGEKFGTNVSKGLVTHNDILKICKIITIKKCVWNI